MSFSQQQQCVLITLGRLPIALDVARGFHALGWRVVVAEPFGMHLARMSRSVARSYTVRAPKKDRQGYLADLTRIIDTEQVSLVVPVSEESMHVAALYELKDVTLFCMPQSTMLALHDKLVFNQTAESFGLSVPQSCAAPDANSRQINRQPFVAKPRRSCSGRGVQTHPAGYSGSFPEDYVIQQRVQGAEFSSFSLAREGQVLCTVVYRARATSGSVAVVFERVDDFVVDAAEKRVNADSIEPGSIGPGSVGPAPVGPDSIGPVSIEPGSIEHGPTGPGAVMPDSIKQWVETFVARSGHTGFISFDFIVDETDTPYALECNPRATSGIHFVAPASLAQTIAGLPNARPALRPYTLMQESYSSYTALLGALADGRERRRRWALLTRARDVTWSRADPWPFLLMIVNTYRLILLAVLKRETFAKVAALDIEWEEHD